MHGCRKGCFCFSIYIRRISYMIEKTTKYSWLVFLISAAFCAYEFILRVKISPLTHQLLIEFNTTANALGFLSSAFFYGYAPTQLFAGTIIQKYGSKKTMSVAILTCALFTLFFSNSSNLNVMFLMRLIIGIGSGFAFIGAYMLVANWFPQKLWVLLYGLIQFIGCLGAMYGQRLLAVLAEIFNWRELGQVLGISGLLLTVLFFFIVRDNQSIKNSNPAFSLTFWEQLKSVAKNPKSYPFVLYAFFCWGPITVSATLWGPAFLSSKLTISHQYASYLFSFVWLGIALGSPFVGFLASKINHHKSLMMACSFIGIVASYFLLHHQNHVLQSYPAILFLIGFATAAQPICFVKIQQVNQDECRGTAVGFTNMAVILSGALLQPLSSVLIERSYRLSLHDMTTTNYSFEHYYNGMMVMPICYLSAFLITFILVKEHRENHPIDLYSSN